MTPDVKVSSSSGFPQQSRRQWYSLTALAVCLFAVVTAVWWFAVRPADAELLTSARTAYARGKYRESNRLARSLVKRQPNSSTALLIAARSAARLGDNDRAIEFYDRIGDDGSKIAIDAVTEAGELLLFQMHRATDAESRFLKVLANRADDITAINRLVYLYSVQGRAHECVEMLTRQIRSGEFTADHLLLIGQRDPFVDGPSTIDSYLQSNADDLVPLIARARIAVSQNRNRDAEKTLRKVLTQEDEQIEAHALMGRALLEMGDERRFLEWHRALPPAAVAHPMVWLVRGHWARRHNDNRVAVRCYWESLRCEPQQKSAIFQLGQALIAVGESEQAELFLDRATMIDEVNALLDLLLSNRQDLESMRQVASRMESMGRVWEAWGWSRLAASVDPSARWAREMVVRIAPQLSSETPLTLISHRPGFARDWTVYPLPTWSSSTSVKDTVTSRNAERFPVTFVESTTVSGIDFAYFNGFDGRKEGRRIYEQMGGGVAVLDYDVDGWPDLYFTQGCTWPPKSEHRQHLDRLYRNLGDGTFDDVTAVCRLTEWGYGQGITVGDFNNDGFPDLLVANIGANRLYENNGDGTFSDVTTAAAVAGDNWTTSCVLADLNGDGAPDLYAVSYLAGDDIFSKVCRDAEGQISVCAPDAFSPAQDRLYVSLGDGKFEEMTVQSGIRAEGGNGLGLVAADFDRSGRLSLFVANDQTANFFFHNRTAIPGGDLSFVESGLTSGLAFDRDGLSLACMGVAAGDANGDGHLDLFVTNYAREPNTLYLQETGLQFADATQRAGLREGSFAMLGFGTQFLDGELDGLPDLVVANGHVNNTGSEGVTYELKPQYFRNVGRGRFIEIRRKTLGPYYQTKHVGRSLARLDWNRDGHEEFAVSHLESPVALLKNTTRDAGNFLAVRLVGVASSRDAIGTSVTITLGGRRQTRQLTAGDGYQASNQRQLIFGLSDNDSVEQIEISWPSGTRQVFRNVPAGAEYLIVEGRQRAMQIPK